MLLYQGKDGKGAPLAEHRKRFDALAEMVEQSGNAFRGLSGVAEYVLLEVMMTDPAVATDDEKRAALDDAYQRYMAVALLYSWSVSEYAWSSWYHGFMTAISIAGATNSFQGKVPSRSAANSKALSIPGTPIEA